MWYGLLVVSMGEGKLCTSPEFRAKTTVPMKSDILTNNCHVQDTVIRRIVVIRMVKTEIRIK